jgi:hypothetical protein
MVAQNSKHVPAAGHIDSASDVDSAAVVADDDVSLGRTDRLHVVHRPR